MSYEQLREQCAIACEQVDALWAVGDDSCERATPEDCAAAVRALPLPSVTWNNERKIFEKWVSDQGVSMDYRGDGIYGNPTVRLWREGFLAALELIQVSPDAEALRKENEQLRELLKDISSNGLRISVADASDCAISARIDSALKGI